MVPLVRLRYSQHLRIKTHVWPTAPAISDQHDHDVGPVTFALAMAVAFRISSMDPASGIDIHALRAVVLEFLVFDACT